MVRALKPLIFTTVGTDHHPFDRLVEWVDGWLLERKGHQRARCLIQSGASRSPTAAEWKDYLSYDQIRSAIGEAAAVVCHGGPATIMECRRHGLIPIVVPRNRELGEHVDDHQPQFARRLAARREIRLVSTRKQLWDLLDQAVAEPQEFRTSRDTTSVDETVNRFSNLVDDLFAGDRAARREASNASLTKGRSSQPPTSTTSRPVSILYIGGWGRSGSTLLARLLGQVPGMVAVGELRDVWLRGCMENRLCGCGTPFLECHFWKAVGREAFGGWNRVDAARMMELRTRFDRPWSMPLILWKGRGISIHRSVDEYIDTLASMYAAIKDVSSARIIVESSKIPSYALLLTQIPGADVRVVHLVRDSRGVVFSWRKHVKKPDRPAAADGMLRYGVVSASARYVFYNALTYGLRWVGTPYLLVRYEDLVRQTDRQLRRVLHGVDVPAAESFPFLEQHSVNLQPTHTVDGNPMRFAEGQVPLKLDDEWRRSMTRKDRLIVSALTSPSLTRYGYLGS